jgi:hypothetical protein
MTTEQHVEFVPEHSDYATSVAVAKSICHSQKPYIHRCFDCVTGTLTARLFEVGDLEIAFDLQFISHDTSKEFGAFLIDSDLRKFNCETARNPSVIIRWFNHSVIATPTGTHCVISFIGEINGGAMPITIVLEQMVDDFEEVREKDREIAFQYRLKQDAKLKRVLDDFSKYRANSKKTIAELREKLEVAEDVCDILKTVSGSEKAMKRARCE